VLIDDVFILFHLVQAYQYDLSFLLTVACHYYYIFIILCYSLFFLMLQLSQSEKAVVRDWTEKLSVGSDLHVLSDGRRRHNKTHSRRWNLTRLISASHNKMPALRGMPVIKAELNFHE